MVLLPGELVEDLQHLVPDDGVQARSGLVQQQDLRPVGQGHGDGQLHPHAPGVVLEVLLPRQGEAGEIALIELCIPALVGHGHHGPHLPGVQDLREPGVVQHHAQPFLHGPEVRPAGLRVQHRDRAAVRPQLPGEKTDGGGLSSPVLAHETQDTALGQG